MYFREFSKKGLDFVGQLFALEGKLKGGIAIKNECHLLESKSFQWMQLVDAFETSWKQSIREQNTNLNSLSLYDHHLKKKQVYSLGKLNSKELCNTLILGNYKKPTSQGYFEPQLLIGKIFICCHVRPPLTQNIALFNTKF